MAHPQREGESGDAPGSVWSAVGQHAGWGLTMAASMGLFLFLGYKLDGALGSTPLLTIVGALLGAGAGFYSMYRHLMEGAGGSGKDSELPGPAPGGADEGPGPPR